MPELPEVECARRLLEEHCVGAKIVSVNARESGGGPRDGQFDDIIMGEGVTEEDVVAALKGRKLLHAGRKGKNLWLELEGKGKHPTMHLGMTACNFRSEQRQLFFLLCAFTVHHNSLMDVLVTWCCSLLQVGDEWPLRFTKLEIDFSNGVKLAFTDPRRLGRICLRADPKSEPPISTLAPDPLYEPPTVEDLVARFAKISAPLKAVLLDQNRIVCGVGNWVADEVCYQAGIHPGSPCNTLSAEQISQLHEALIQVVTVACEANADSDKYPKSWLFHYRWSKRNNGGKVTDAHGNPIEFETVGGRTTALVPKVMKKGNGTPPAPKPKAPRQRAKAKKETAVQEEEGGSTKPAAEAEKKPRGRGNASKKKADEEGEEPSVDEGVEEQAEESSSAAGKKKRGAAAEAEGEGGGSKAPKRTRVKAGGAAVAASAKPKGRARSAKAAAEADEPAEGGGEAGAEEGGTDETAATATPASAGRAAKQQQQGAAGGAKGKGKKRAADASAEAAAEPAAPAEEKAVEQEAPAPKKARAARKRGAAESSKEGATESSKEGAEAKPAAKRARGGTKAALAEKPPARKRAARKS
ncbi:Formamidopyrimidine-DNA glycosylase H2TH domain-containing protein [Tribonema minus]|uniref:Formamidopyrimidine-DNA glycosylase H2TH domain-containing protein n=1 Tax=Tribonema minus TaxID=303371 RepID=A0A835YY62_9STRA|nr:Formamidopyrimidine-DNA glycosylase H2TH domain-containing protein [Tribonema minus]